MTLSDIDLLRRRIDTLEHSTSGDKDCFRDRLAAMRQRLKQMETRQVIAKTPKE